MPIGMFILFRSSFFLPRLPYLSFIIHDFSPFYFILKLKPKFNLRYFFLSFVASFFFRLSFILLTYFLLFFLPNFVVLLNPFISYSFLLSFLFLLKKNFHSFLIHVSFMSSIMCPFFECIAAWYIYFFSSILRLQNICWPCRLSGMGEGGYVSL